MKFIVASLGVYEDQVCYASYTGKAAQVLLAKGNKNVMTLHKLLYESFPLPDGTFSHRKKAKLDCKIVIVDECSMAPMELVKLLLSHKNIFVVFCGDPGQLPPISKDDDNHLLDNPDVFLDEIHRQALDSEIIRLSMDIREGKPLSQFDGKDVKVFRRDQLSEGMLQWADQIICSTNATRISINNTMRELNGREGGPQSGDKVICCRNYWETFADNEDPLVNGTIGYLKNAFSTFVTYPRYLAGGGRIDLIHADFTSDTGAEFQGLSMDLNMLVNGEFSLDPKKQYIISKNPKYRRIVPMEFAYGYAITGHRSQGSQWPKVLVLEENFPFSREEHKRWLYTTCTRPEEKLVLITKE